MFKRFNITAVNEKQDHLASIEVETSPRLLLSKALGLLGEVKWKEEVHRIEVENQEDGSIIIAVYDTDFVEIGYVLAGVSEDQ